MTVRFRSRLSVLVSALTLAAPILVAQTQTQSQTSQPTSAVPMPTAVKTIIRTDTIADSLKRPPISTKRAFLSSLLIPGFAQARLNRPLASMVFAAAEILSFGMSRKAAQDLREARGAIHDSTRTVTIDPATGVADTIYNHTRFTNARLRARRVHYEDWIAALIFNHLISSADAFVSANLWDFDANIAPSVSINPVQKSASVGGSITF